MQTTEIIEFLEENGLSEIEEVKTEDNFIVLKFYYDFDKEEILAARAYANEESDLEEESDEWYRDWYLSYLSDVAKDNVEGIVEDLGDELELASKIKEVEIDVNNADYMKFVTILCSEDFEEDLEEVLNDYL
ncbi:MAG: hypothetical protein KIC66_02090 [Clostridium sp.]|uniref:Uncharacterized protein n=1 Tax=Clostridium paraputrificum TaxID=29363 RepID=A0A6N3C169_9CLOT|nr:hypothetical protein [Clostridium sp.]MBS5925863.1 hypothetical protein [Clostridium sp.]MBS5987409.1 hypothetical protein [Clostridium sp.]